MTTDISIVRWDPSQNNGQEYIDEYEYDGGNSSSRLFERSRIKALAGNTIDMFKVIGTFANPHYFIFNRGA